MTGEAGKQKWNWIWPSVGATPVNHGLDPEIFDRTDCPYTETFVREAIQNSLDARRDENSPVVVRFSFHEENMSARQEAFLAEAMEHRARAERPVIEEWGQGVARWLVVEDFNAKGLAGALDDRMGDFWNYWLNFGISNKDGTQRGGRGIGRVTFLIASQMQTVIGYTRRQVDGLTAACGMCVLKPMMDGQRLLSTHAYMAKEILNDCVYDLHQPPVHEQLVSAFKLEGYQNPERDSGLALIIPYPHTELTAEGILASSIDHFAPAIMSGSLVIEADGERLDADTISAVAAKVTKNIRSEAVRSDVARYLSLIQLGLNSTPVRLPAAEGADLTLEGARSTEILQKIQTRVLNEDPVVLEIPMPLVQHDKAQEVTLTAVAQRTPANKPPIDRLFREGMALPDTRAKSPGDLDMILLVHDGDLATYLNLCEGKAHLDLQDNKEIRAKLVERGYLSGRTPYRTMRFVRSLPTTLRQLLTPETDEPDASVFDSFFSIPSDKPGKSTGDGKDKPPPPPPPPPEPRIRVFNVTQLKDGLAVTANPEFKDWPVSVTIGLAYADGSRKPSWSEYDFRLEDMPMEHANCDIMIAANKIKATDCGPETEIRITGFDTKRELDATIRPTKNAQKN